MNKLQFFPKNINEECGVFGVYNCANAAELTYYGLHALQHRGQEGCGIATSNGTTLFRERGEGLVTEIFSEKKLTNLDGNCAIGHVRYSTAGGGGIDNVQPFVFRHHTGDFSLCHNGNIVNSRELKLRLEMQGSIFHTTSDTEVISYIITKERLSCDTIEAAVSRAMGRLRGAYSLVIMSPTKLIAARDENGFRPLCYGITDDGRYVVASESCALDAVSA